MVEPSSEEDLGVLGSGRKRVKGLRKIGAFLYKYVHGVLTFERKVPKDTERTKNGDLSSQHRDKVREEGVEFFSVGYYLYLVPSVVDLPE